ncbi:MULTISPECIES: hypothetical protein [unclassified Mameliella]|uniref:hypothetical protein n=1 Tax=unclassified Mameliella TaxID=2630630 RepID=UPI00273D505F|nr:MULTISPECIES: hypothetical protein [unclassified Mameliella]
MTDTELFATMKDRLFTAVIGDVLDTMGHRRQFLPQPIKLQESEEQAIGLALENVATENEVAKDIQKGMCTQEAFATFGAM